MRSSSDWEVGPQGELRRRQRGVGTRGLTKDCSRRMKNIFKGAAQTASLQGPLVGYYKQLLASGRKSEIARVGAAAGLRRVVDVEAG